MSYSAGKGLMLATGLLALAQSDSNTPAAVGLLLRTRGATISRASSRSASTAKSGDILFAGDRLLSPEEPISFIYCPEKTSITLAGGSTATLQAKGMLLSAGRITDRKPVASCFLPQMVRVALASRQHYGVALVRAELDQLAARLQSMTEAQRNAFFAEWKPVEAALLQDPRNERARAQATAILAKYGIPAEALDQVPALAPSPALQLWRELVRVVAANNLTAARRAIAKAPDASASLYRELLFDAVDSLLGPSSPVSPLAGKVRALLAQSDKRSAALEAQFRQWERDRNKPFGGGSPMADLVGNYIDVFSRTQPSAEQYQAILDAALPLGVELAAAGAWSNLSANAVQEGRPEEALPPLKLAEMVWRSWNHAADLMLADFWTGKIDEASGRLEPALHAYERAAQAAAAVPEMRKFRMDALSALANVQRSLGASDTTASAFGKWWPHSQTAVAKHDAKAVAAGAHFPLNWENGPIREIKTEAHFLKRFDDYFTGEIRNIIAARTPERLPSGTYILTWKARGNEYSLYFISKGSGPFVLDGLSEGPP